MVTVVIGRGIRGRESREGKGERKVKMRKKRGLVFFIRGINITDKFSIRKCNY